MLKAIVTHLNIPDEDPDVSVLEEATQPGRLVEQIEKVIEHGGRVRPKATDALREVGWKSLWEEEKCKK